MAGPPAGPGDCLAGAAAVGRRRGSRVKCRYAEPPQRDLDRPKVLRRATDRPHAAHEATPTLAIPLPRADVVDAVPWRDELQTTSRRCQGLQDGLLLRGDRAERLLDAGPDVLDERQPGRQESPPVAVIGIGDLAAIVERGEESLGEDVAELLTPSTDGTGEGVVRLLERDSDLAHRPEHRLSDEEEPVLVVDLGKERVDPIGRHGQCATADEGVLRRSG